MARCDSRVGAPLRRRRRRKPGRVESFAEYWLAGRPKPAVCGLQSGSSVITGPRTHPVARLPWLSFCRWTVVSVSTTVLLVLSMPLLVSMRTVSLMPLIVVAITFAIVLTERARRRGRSPSFSLRSLLLVVGLVFCLSVLWRDGAAWHPVHEFPGFFSTAVFSPDARLAAATGNSKNLSIEIRERGTHRPPPQDGSPARHSTGH